MATKSEQFSVKLGCLKECLSRLKGGKNVATFDNETIISLMKYFTKVILNIQCQKSSETGIVLWPPTTAWNSVCVPDQWNQYFPSYPSLDYSTLHDLTLSMLQCLSFTVDTKDACGCSLEMLSHTLPFIQENLRMELPLQVSYLLPRGDFDFHGLIIDALCESIIPMCFGYVIHDTNQSILSANVSSILTILFEFVMDPPLHMKLLEVLMLFKRELWKDMLTVIAYGSEPVKICAVRYLFHLWPDFRKDDMLDHVIPLNSMPAMIYCENKSCKSKNDIVATSALCDPSLSAKFGWKNAPLYICDGCKNTIRSKNNVPCFFDILLRKETVSYSCENKNCFSRNTTGTVTVCGIDLSFELVQAARNAALDKHRTRYCNECYNNLAKFFQPGQLLVQYSPDNIWNLQRNEDKTVMADAIVSLLNDSPSPLAVTGSCVELCDEQPKTSYFYLSAFDGSDIGSFSELSDDSPENFQYLCRACRDNLWNTKGSLQGQFGIWMLLSLCPVSQQIPLDKLIKGWMTDVSIAHIEEYTSHLLPRKLTKDVTEQWYNLCPEWQNYFTGLRLIVCLASYSIIKKDTWDKVMPHWVKLLDQKFDDIKDKKELRDVIIKMFDIDLSPLAFESKYLFEFAIRLCENPDIRVQMKGLAWLLVLTEIGVIIPISTLLDVFLKSTRLLMSSKEHTMGMNLQETVSDSDSTGFADTDFNYQGNDACVRRKTKAYLDVLECLTTMINIIEHQMHLREDATNESVLNEWISSLLILLTEQLDWICDDNRVERSGGEAEAAGTQQSIFVKENEETKLMSILPISWLWKAFDILQAVLAKKMDKKTFFLSVGGDFDTAENIDENCRLTLKLSLKLTKVLSSKHEPIEHHITLQIIDLLCEYSTLSDVASVPNYDCNPDDFAIIYAQLWAKIPSSCYDLLSCATSVLFRTLFLPVVAENFITLIEALLTSQEWTLRYDTIDKMQYLIESVQQQHVENHSCFTHVISSCFRSLLPKLHDAQLEVQMKCRHMIENLSLTSLKNVSGCLEQEFAKVPHLRTNLLMNMETINQLRPEINLFSVFYSGCIEYYMQHERNGHGQVGFGGYGQRGQEVAMSRETVHLLFSIISKYIMEYSVRPKVAESSCFQSMQKNYFAHFGYNDQPSEIRSSVGFSSFLLNLPKILDTKVNLGSSFIGTAITLLENSIFPDFAKDGFQSFTQLSLSVLPKPLQLAWISSLLILLYKFNATDNSQLLQLERLVTVCLNALETEIHICSLEHTFLRFQPNKTENAGAVSDMQPEFNNTTFSAQSDAGTGKRLSRLSQDSNFGHHIASVENDTHSKPIQKTGRNSKTQDIADSLVSSNTPKKQSKARDGQSIKSKRSSRGLNRFGSGTSGESEFPGDSRDESNGDNEEFARIKKRSSASMSSSSQSPYRRRNNSDISRDWNKMMTIPFQNVVMSPSCHKCKEKLFGFPPNILSGCILNLCYFVKSNGELAAPLLPRILTQLVHISHLLGDGAKEKLWKSALIEGSTVSSSHLVYSNVSRVARQSVRCILQQLSSTLLLTKVFLLPLEDHYFLHGIAACLSDNQNLNSLTAVKFVVEGLPQDLKDLSDTEFNCLLANLASYMEILPQDSQSSLHWQQVLACFSVLCNKINGVLQCRERCNADGLFNIAVILLNSPSPLPYKQTLMEAFTKLLVVILQRCNFSVKALHSLCFASCKVFTRAKEKFFLMRYVVSELISCLKLKSKFLHESVKLRSKYFLENLLMLLQLILVDVGSCLNPCGYQNLDSRKFVLTRVNLPCCMTECIKSHLHDCKEIIADLDFLNNFKEHVYCGQSLIIHGSICADVKVSIAQLVCMELSSQTPQADKTLQSLFPWIFETPSSVQQGPKDYLDCVSHIRQLSWILLGSLTHIGLFRCTLSPTWQPLPVNISSHLAAKAQLILTGFPAQYAESVTSLPSLFYLFVFCQLWTLYCDEMSSLLYSTNSSVQGSSVLGWDQNLPNTLIMEFWNRVTPSILILLQKPHNKSISNLVHAHVISILECLQEYNSAIVFKLYSLWKVMLESRLSGSGDSRSTSSNAICMRERLNIIQRFYTSAFNDHMKKRFDMSSECANEPELSARRLLEIVGKIKERLAQAEATGQTADDLYIIH